MIFALLAAWNIFAAETLDTDMTAQEKKQTGIYKLDDQQKAALQQWINAHYQKKTEEAAAEQPISGKNPTLSENLMNSQYLRLSDNTLWSVRPQDVPIAQGWITPVEILVTQSTNPFFPTKLTNKLTGSSILVRKVDKLPPASSPPIAPENSGKLIPGGPAKKPTP